MKGWKLGVTALTFIVLAVGLLFGGIWMASMLAKTNQMIWMLGALLCWAAAALYAKLFIAVLD